MSEEYYNYDDSPCDSCNMIEDPKKGCKHKDCWILAGGNYLWCPYCGAIRRTEQSQKTNSVYPVWKKWLYPKGQDITLKKWERIK